MAKEILKLLTWHTHVATQFKADIKKGVRTEEENLAWL